MPNKNPSPTVAIVGGGLAGLAAAIALREHYDQQKQEQEAMGVALDGDSLVFSRLDGSPLPPITVNHAFIRILKKVGLEGIRMHDLRHTHATLMMKQGVNPKIVQERLGHSSFAVTMDIYSHVAPGLQEAAALAFDQGLRRHKNADQLVGSNNDG